MILVKTEAGQQAFKDRTIRLSPRQRSAFILCDGRRSVDEVIAAGAGIVREDIEQMVDLGMLGRNAGEQPAAASAVPSPGAMPVMAASLSVAPLRAPADPATVPATPAAATMGRSAQQRYQDAYPIATRLTSDLGLRGFRLNLAVESATTYEQLAALAPKIRAAVGADKALDLERALLA